MLETIKLLKECGIWIEVTTLIIPTKNDSEKELNLIAEYIARIDEDIPWHISAFYPTYKLLNVQPTSPKTLLHARDIGIKTGLHYVYTGNIYNKNTETTFCNNCKKPLIERHFYDVVNRFVVNAYCPYCGNSIAGVGLDTPELLH